VAADLLVADYDLAEQEAISVTPNLIVQAVQPIVFNAMGYPSRVRSEAELFKYIDVMHEGGYEYEVLGLLQGLTENEFELVKRLTTSVNRFGQERFGKKRLSRASMLGGMNVLRHIRYLYGDARPRIFEIGPGNGYLGALLIDQGYPYAATDVSQAFYLYQNHFWNYISQGSVVELTHENPPEEGFEAPSPGNAVHLPWWKFMGLKPDAVPQFDVITCNRTLSEMHPSSLGFAIKIAQAMLSGAPDEPKLPKAIVFHGWGDQNHGNKASVTQGFYRSGLVLVHNDSQISVVTPAGTENALDYLKLPSRKRQKMVGLRNYMRKVLGEAPMRGPSPFTPDFCSSSLNPLSHAVVAGREAERDQKVIGIEQLDRFYTELMGGADLTSADEHFLMLADN